MGRGEQKAAGCGIRWERKLKNGNEWERRRGKDGMGVCGGAVLYQQVSWTLVSSRVRQLSAESVRFVTNAYPWVRFLFSFIPSLLLFTGCYFD